MAKKPNYSFEKRQRELEKQKKKDQKKADRRKAGKEPSPAEKQGEATPDEGPLENH